MKGILLLGMKPDDGDLSLIFIFLWPIPFAMAIGGAVLLVVSYKARRHR